MRALLVLVVVLLVTLAGCVAEPRLADPLRDDASQRQTVLSWSSQMEGHLGLEITVDFGDDNNCTYSVGAAFGTRTSPVLYAHQKDGAPYGSLILGEILAAHGGPVDTRDAAGEWGLAANFSLIDGDVFGKTTVLSALFDLQAWDNAVTGSESVSVWLSCEHPFVVESLMAGRHLVGFTKTHGLDGGVGVETLVPFAAGASVSLGVQRSDTFEAPRVATRIHSSTFLAGATVGTLQVQHPEGSESWDLTQTRLASFDGGPGTYQVTVDRASASYFADTFFGYLIGLDEIASLEGIDGLPLGP